MPRGMGLRTFGSPYGAQDLEIFVGTFPVVKLIFAVAVLVLLMYTWQQKFAKRYPRDTKRINPTVKEDSLPGESTETLVQNVTKKRRRRKKKNVTQESEEFEQSKDGNKSRERTGHGGNVEKRNKGDHASKNAKPGGRLDEAKDGKRVNDSVTSRSATRKGENPDASWTVKVVKNIVAGLSKEFIDNAIDENTVYRDKKQRKVKNPRNIQNKAADISDSSGALRNNGTLLRRETCHKANREQTANVREQKEVKCQDDDKAGYTENCTQKRFSSDIPDRQWNKTNHDTNDPDHRRRSFDHSFEKDPRESELPENHRHCPTVDRARRRSIDRSSQKDPGENDSSEHSTDTRTRRRSFSSTSENDLRESELPESDRHPSDYRRRRRSFEHTSENDTNDSEHKENHQHPIDNQRRQSSCRRASKGVPRGNEHPENHRHYPSYNRTRRSSHRTSEDDPRGSELVENQRNPIDNRRRRKSFDRSPNNDAERNELMEDNRCHPRDKQSKQKSYERNANNAEKRSEFLENQRHFSTTNKTTSDETEKIEDYEERITENEMEPSTVHITVANPDEENTSSTHKADKKRSVQTVDGRGSSQGQFFIDPEVRERIANPKHPVRMPDKPFLHLSYQDGSQRYDDNVGPNKSFVGGPFGRKWRDKMEQKALKQELEDAVEEERSRAILTQPGDNICPTFMIWGVCHRGDHCPLRHPSYRYLERPPRKVLTPDSVPEEQKKDPNSYAAILEKNKSSESQEFFNEGVLCKAETTVEANERSYSNAVVNARQEHDNSNVLVTKNSFEEAWPSLKSAVQGTKAFKAWQPKDVPNVHQAWTTQKGQQIEEESKATVEYMPQIINDGVIADELQAQEYEQINDDDYGYSYNQEEEFIENSYYDQEQDTNTENETLSHTQQETKARELEWFGSSYSRAIITEVSTGDGEDPTPPPAISAVCDICMDRPKDATLVCGHRFCYQCALQMRLDERVCAICRRCIVSVIKTYN